MIGYYKLIYLNLLVILLGVSPSSRPPGWLVVLDTLIKFINRLIPEILKETRLPAFPLFYPRGGFIELNPNRCAHWKQKFLTLCWFLFCFFQSTKGFFDQLHVFLSSAAREQPLVILLDSFDQLSPHGARKLTWFPRQLPLHGKSIVSTLPHEEYKSFLTLKVSQC